MPKHAVNHQVPNGPVEDRDAIRAMFKAEFAVGPMTCIIETIFEHGEWAILEWRDPSGLRGRGFFRCPGGKIRFHRGYRDKLAALRLKGGPVRFD